MQEYPEFFHFSFSVERPSQHKAHWSEPKNRDLAATWDLTEPHKTGRFNTPRNVSNMPGFAVFDWQKPEAYDAHWGTRTAPKNWANRVPTISSAPTTPSRWSRPQTSHSARSAPGSGSRTPRLPSTHVTQRSGSAAFRSYQRIPTPTEETRIRVPHAPLRPLASRVQSRSFASRPATADSAVLRRSLRLEAPMRGARSPASTPQKMPTSIWRPVPPTYGRNRPRELTVKEPPIDSREVMNATLPKDHLVKSLYGPGYQKPGALAQPFFPVENGEAPVERDFSDDPSHCKYCNWLGCRGCELGIGHSGFGTQNTHFTI